MADVPFAITSEMEVKKVGGKFIVDASEMKSQIYELVRNLYEEKIGGADLGDVFSLDGDVLTLVLDTSTPGLQKTGNVLAVKAKSGGGISVDSDGIYVTSDYVPDGGVTPEKFADGAVMLPFYDTADGTEYSTAFTTYTTKVSYRFYVPDGATTIRCAYRLRCSNYPNGAYARIVVGSSSSGGSYTTSTSYIWGAVDTVDVSGESGWVNFSIQIKVKTGNTAYLQGYAFIWEAGS